ncbi:hypothetical protein BKA62DRAFT_703573 [Auriculariales sp. MPI-PUGE-AT-0066]|nr:hypothetical protein BKA62DRAFT_703573 [Auriculariales sp. MPI-PUGE-AT-0066]
MAFLKCLLISTVFAVLISNVVAAPTRRHMGSSSSTSSSSSGSPTSIDSDAQGDCAECPGPTTSSSGVSTTSPPPPPPPSTDSPTCAPTSTTAPAPALPTTTAASGSLTDTARIGLLVPFTAKTDTAESVQTFVQSASSLAAAEPGTLQWFGASAQNASTPDLFVFDTFATEDDRKAHLAGQVAGGLLSQISSLTSLEILPYDIYAIKSLNNETAVASATACVNFGLRVFFNATSADTVAGAMRVCTDGLALIEAEAGTLNWVCGQIPGTLTFLILDSFATEEARDTHLNGKFVASLVAAVGVSVNAPDVVKIEIFTGTTKADAGSGEESDGGFVNTTTGSSDNETSGDIPDDLSRTDGWVSSGSD